MIITTKINMDLQNRHNIPMVDAVQTDSYCRNLELWLFDGQAPFAIPADVQVELRYKKADGKSGLYDTLPDGRKAWQAEENRLTLALTPQMLTFPGAVALTVTLVKDAVRLNSFPIALQVSPAAKAVKLESEDYFRLSGFLKGPQARPGQFLRVAQVDGDGNAKTLEAADVEAQLDEAQVRQIVGDVLAENPPKDGITPELSVGEVKTLEPGADATASITGTAENPVLNLGIPGAVTPAISVGTVTTLAPGADATASITGTAENPVLNLGIPGSEEQLPAYWQAKLEQGAQDINTALLAAGQERSAFLFYTDAHWDAGGEMSIKLLKSLCRHTGMNKVFFGGDIVNQEGDDYATMAYLWQWRQQVKQLPNHHSVVGNHDDGNATNNRFSEQYVYGYLLSPEETGDMHTDGKGLYYYVDRPGERTRYLFLDTAYKGVVTAQADFVRQALLSTPEKWHIVAVSHIWVDMDYSLNPPGVGDINPEAAKLLALFDSYNSRSGAFSGCKGWVEFCIGGHAHQDLDRVSESGIPILLLETASGNTRSGLPAGAGTANETAVSAVVADYGAHTVRVIRVGRGQSRDVAIVNYPVSYTNVLSSAVDENGQIYNGIGYKADTRWSGSSNAAVTAAGKYLTGYIPYQAGQTVYMKNVTFQLDTANVHRFSALGERLASQNGTEVEAYMNPAYDENGNVTQFTVPTSGTYTQTNYIRIECTGLSEKSVITVDEPLT